MGSSQFAGRRMRLLDMADGSGVKQRHTANRSNRREAQVPRRIELTTDATGTNVVLATAIRDLFDVGLKLQALGLEVPDPTVRSSIDKAAGAIERTICGLTQKLFDQ